MKNDNQTSAQRTAQAVDSPIFLTFFRLAVPTLLGVIVAYLAGISSAQTDQGKQLATLQGQVGVFAQQSTDYVGRLSKVEVAIDEVKKNQAANTANILVLQSARRYK